MYLHDLFLLLAIHCRTIGMSFLESQQLGQFLSSDQNAVRLAVPKVKCRFEKTDDWLNG